MEIAVRTIRQSVTQVSKKDEVESIGYVAKLCGLAFAAMIAVCVGVAVVNDPSLLITVSSAANFM